MSVALADREHEERRTGCSPSGVESEVGNQLSTIVTQRGSSVSPAEPLSQFGIRAIQEAMAAAMPSTWLQKAATMEAARPKPGDFHGRATADELAERDDLLALTAEQCRVHAAFLTDNPDVLAQVIAADVESLMLGAEAVNHRGN